MADFDRPAIIVQARLASTRVPLKMTREFTERSEGLFALALRKLRSSSVVPFENVYACVGDLELVRIARQEGANVLDRSAESLQEPNTLQRVFEWHERIRHERYVVVNACSPLLTLPTIDGFYLRFANTRVRGSLGVTTNQTFVWGQDGRLLPAFFGTEEEKATLETKLIEQTFESANALYAGTVADIAAGIYMGEFKNPDDPTFVELPPEECLDIDWPWQFEMAKMTYREIERRCGKEWWQKKLSDCF